MLLTIVFNGSSLTNALALDKAKLDGGDAFTLVEVVLPAGGAGGQRTTPLCSSGESSSSRALPPRPGRSGGSVSGGGGNQDRGSRASPSLGH